MTDERIKQVPTFSSEQHKALAKELHKIHFIYRGSNTPEMRKAPILITANLCEFFKTDNSNFDEIVFMKIVHNGTEKSFKEIILSSDRTGE